MRLELPKVENWSDLDPLGPLGVADRNDVQAVVAHLADLLVLVVHEIDQIGRRLRLLDHVLPGALVAQDLLEHEDDLQDDLVVLLLGLQQLDQRYNHLGPAEEQGAQFVAGAGPQIDDRVQHKVVQSGARHEELPDPGYQLEVLQDLRIVQIGEGEIAQNAEALHHEGLVVADGEDAGKVADIVEELQLEGLVLREIAQQLHQQGVLVLEGAIHEAVEALALHHDLGVAAIQREIDAQGDEIQVDFDIQIEYYGVGGHLDAFRLREHRLHLVVQAHVVEDLDGDPVVLFIINEHHQHGQIAGADHLATQSAVKREIEDQLQGDLHQVRVVALEQSRQLGHNIEGAHLILVVAHNRQLLQEGAD